MLEQGYINQSEYQFAKVSQIYPAEKANLLPKGAPATLVYPPQQEVVAYPYFVDYVRRYLELDPRIGPSLLYRGGLRIQTTLDPVLQQEAQSAVNDTLSGTSPPLEMSLVSVEPQTGFVKAMIGGRDFTADQTNLALGGCERPSNPNYTVLVPATCWDGNTVEGGGTGRQAGSAFKPFTLAVALSRGISPERYYYAPIVYSIPGCTGPASNGCTIHNAGDGEGGFGTTLRQATWKSINTVYAQVITDPNVGVQRVADMAKNLGVTSAWYSPQVHGPSYTLGVVGVSPLDMASAYGVFDNHGVRVPATPVVLVEDAQHRILVDNRPNPNKPAGNQVIDPAVADNVTDILRGVITSGTGTSANINRPAAGKTGTTSDYADAWFVGYVPTLSTAVWMGYKDRETHSMRYIKGVGPVYGGTWPARTWAAYMSQAVKDVPVTDFSQPAPLKPIADQLDRVERGGIDPGYQRYPDYAGVGGPYQYSAPAPVAVAPTTTSTTTTPGSTTTTTFAPGGPGPPITVP
jgi:penicillin-binding protein 1A